MALRVTQSGATLSICDSGVGFVEVETARRGMGLVKRLVTQVGGSMARQSGDGTTWTIKFAPDEVVPQAA